MINRIVQFRAAATHVGPAHEVDFIAVRRRDRVPPHCRWTPIRILLDRWWRSLRSGTEPPGEEVERLVTGPDRSGDEAAFRRCR